MMLKGEPARKAEYIDSAFCWEIPVIFNQSYSRKFNRARHGVVVHVNTRNVPPRLAGLLYVEEPIECSHKPQITMTWPEWKNSNLTVTLS